MPKGKGFRSSVTPGYLRGFGAVFILGTHNDRFDMGKHFDVDQLEALRNYVAKGGNLLITPSIYGSGFNYLEVKDGLSTLCKKFGVSFPIDHGDLIGSEKRVESKEAHYPGKKSDWAIVKGRGHALTKDVAKIAFGPHGGAFLKVDEEPGDPLVKSVDVIMKTGKEHTPANVPVMTLTRYGEGNALVVGSPSAFMYPDFLQEGIVDNAKLLRSILNYFLGSGV